MATTVRPAPRDEVTPPGGPSAGPPRRRLWVLAMVGILAVIGAHLALMAYMRAPVIHPDELGYVQNAHYLARGGLRPTTEYYPGYSLLLVPLWWASRVPLTVWRGALVINSLLAGATAVLAWCLLARLSPALNRGWRALIVAATAAYPALLLFSDFSMSETAFATAFLAVCLVAAWVAPRVAWRGWAALGLACGLLALVHPRGFAVYVAAALLGLAALAPLGWRRAARPVAALAGGLAVGFAVARLLVVSLKDPKSRFSSYSPGGILSRAASLHGFANLVSEAGGQLFYLSVATFGLVPFGLWVSLRAVGDWAKGDRRPVVLARAFPGVAFLGVWGVSSLFMNLGTRADKLIYGRYNDAAIAPLLLLALSELAAPFAAARGGRGRRRARVRAVATWAAVGSAALVVTAAFTGLGHPGSEVHGPLNPVNVIAIVPYIRHFGGKVEVLALLGVGIAGLAALGLVSLRWPALGASALAVGFVVLAVRTQATYIVPGTRARAAQDAVPLALAAIRSGTSADLACVAWDNPLADDFALYATQFALPDQRIRPYGGALGGPCGQLVVSPDADFGAHNPGARLVTSDPYAGEKLWALPGATANVLAAGGWLFPAGPPAALPADARAGALSVATPTVTVRSGGTATVRVTATHPAGGAPWATLATFPAGQDAVRLSLQWTGEGGALTLPAAAGCPSFSTPASAVACESADLPRVVLPGASVTITATVHAVAADGKPLPPGRYTLRLGLYQQLVGTFDGSGATTVEVQVTP